MGLSGVGRYDHGNGRVSCGSRCRRYRVVTMLLMLLLLMLLRWQRRPWTREWMMLRRMLSRKMMLMVMMMMMLRKDGRMLLLNGRWRLLQTGGVGDGARGHHLTGSRSKARREWKRCRGGRMTSGRHRRRRRADGSYVIDAAGGRDGGGQMGNPLLNGVMWRRWSRRMLTGAQGRADGGRGVMMWLLLLLVLMTRCCSGCHHGSVGGYCSRSDGSLNSVWLRMMQRGGDGVGNRRRRRRKRR